MIKHTKMIVEIGRVVAVGSDHLWVETIRQSTCGSCVMKKGCGHSLLNQMGAKRHHHLRVLLNTESPDVFSVNDNVKIAIPERLLVEAAFIVYLIPLIGLLIGAVLASLQWQGDLATVVGGGTGFAVGIALVWCHSVLSRNNSRLQPVVLSNGEIAVS